MMIRYNDEFYTTKLDNGLTVQLFRKKGFNKSYFLFGTPIGSFDTNQLLDGKTKVSYPLGIAHFLEHKMFEKANVDVMDEFAKMGAQVNAFTSYEETCYYFSTNKEYKKALNLLLDFVQELSLTKESVEKEKGIIVQELNMYKQISDMNLSLETFKSLYKEHPIKDDIGGDEKNVLDTTLEQLCKCYDLNYHPSRMILIGVIGSDIEEVLQVIKDNQDKKEFKEFHSIKREILEEQKEVVRKNYEFSMDINIPKVTYAIKLEPILEPVEREKMQLALEFLIKFIFTPMNDDYQKWINEEIINDSFDYDVGLSEENALVMFENETNKIEEFYDLIQRQISDFDVSSFTAETLEQLKRRSYGSTLRMLDDFGNVAVRAMRSYFAGLDFYQSIDLINEITLDDIKKAYKLLCNDNVSKVKLLPK